MSNRFTRIDDASSVLLPPEAIEALGVNAGGELNIEIVGRALVVRSVEEAQRSREFLNIFESVLKERREAYEQWQRALSNPCDEVERLLRLKITKRSRQNSG